MAGSVVVTGASSGIGRACALRLDRLGFRVFAGVRRPEDGEALRAAGAGVEPVLLELTDPASIAAAAERVAGAVGETGLRGLVNNAGIAIAVPVELLPLDELRRQLEVNVVGQVAVIRAFLPLLRSARGRLVNVGSISGRSALPFMGPYAASKHALEALSDALRVELRPWGIRVSIVEPGTIATPIWSKGGALADEIARSTPPEALELYRGSSAAFRAVAAARASAGAAPEAVAQAIEHALTARRPRARYLVGRDARTRARLERLPVGLRDALLARRLTRPR